MPVPSFSTEMLILLFSETLKPLALVRFPTRAPGASSKYRSIFSWEGFLEVVLCPWWVQMGWPPAGPKSVLAHAHVPTPCSKVTTPGLEGQQRCLVLVRCALHLCLRLSAFSV